MAMIDIDVDRDIKEGAKRVVSNAYDSDEWCEPDSIRQDIKDLQSEVRTHLVLIKTINKMLHEISRTPTMKQELDNMDYHRQQQGDSYDDK
jgi:hypothetical protein